MIGLRRKEGPAGAVCEARVRIVTAARHAFASVGFAGASTREIAKEAGVAQSLLLYHFGSKDALWRAVMDGLAEDLRTRMNAAIATSVSHCLLHQSIAHRSPTRSTPNTPCSVKSGSRLPARASIVA